MKIILSFNVRYLGVEWGCRASVIYSLGLLTCEVLWLVPLLLVSFSLLKEISCLIQ